MKDEQKRELKHSHKLLDEKLEHLYQFETELRLLEYDTLRLLHRQVMVSGIMILTILALCIVSFALA